MSGIDRLLAGDEAAVCLRGDVESTDRSAVSVLMPGAFNPLHDGHARMTDVAAELLAQEVDFEISVRNVDKGELSASAIRHRLKQFGVSQPVWITRAPTFVEKSFLFPAATFVVGVDTISRIADSTYYKVQHVDRDQALLAITERNCRFLVFGRLVDGVFTQLSDLSLPPRLRDICRGVDEAEFRLDVSSSEIRARFGG